ncbi:GNAT family N-acetyltransferase [Metabacillus sp. JX24]|uniref:GNAT family N-acetyltransferase n=1 Tax=Metabacillus sp. JX24 TaxID=3240759 RepID=UPI00350EC2E4
MDVLIEKVDRQTAVDILGWRYEAPYDFYNMEVSEENIHGMLTHPYYAMKNRAGETAGFFCFGITAQVPSRYMSQIYSANMIDIGLGMNPRLTGKGQGSAFFAFILNQARAGFPNTPLRLTVACFNERASRIYEKAGFKEAVRFEKEGVTFKVMVLEERGFKRIRQAQV